MPKNNLLKAEIDEISQLDDYIDDITLDDEDLEEEQETSFDRETNDYDFDVEDDWSIDELTPAKQLNDYISFDSIKLRLPLTEAEYVGFEVERTRFFRSPIPERATKEKEDMLHLVGIAENPVRTMELDDNEESFVDRSLEFEFAKVKYPNAKPFYDFCGRLGVGHMYFKNGEFICQINGKITAKKGYLGLINIKNINEALDELKRGLVDFDNEKFVEKAQVLLVHTTNDIKVSDVNSNVKAFSSFLPLRTDKYNVLKYGVAGYEVLPRGKESNQTAKHRLCIYNKGKEIGYRNQSSYQRKIGREGLRLAENVIRIELRLMNFAAIRKYFAPTQKDGSITLQELLNSSKTPIIERLKELEITKESLVKARGEYISMQDDKLPKLAEFQRIHGVIHLLKQNDYSLDKVRSYLEIETGKPVRSDELKRMRELMQRYIACYKPRTVALLTELLAGMSY